MDQDVRWRQRFANFCRALENLERASIQDSYNELERQGYIKGFELCHELAWKTIQDVLRERGYEGISGPKPVIRQAFIDGLITDGELWATIHEARNLAAHTYDLERAVLLEREIKTRFLAAFQQLRTRLDGLDV
jgi:nucleotidyltransferase substrate binding protein (TIGR01987 family)